MYTAANLAFLAATVADYRSRSYAFWLPYLTGKTIVPEITAPDAMECCVKINASWHDKPYGDIRVNFSINHGEQRTLMPVTNSFIIAPNGSFIDE